MLLSACGAADGDVGQGVDADDPGPTVADAELTGIYVVERLVGQPGPMEPAVTPVIEIDTRFGDLTVEPGCNTFLGSFTLDDDGTASFTVTGGTKKACPDLAADGVDQDRFVLDALAAVDRWSRDGDGLLLTGPDAELVLRPA